MARPAKRRSAATAIPDGRESEESRRSPATGITVAPEPLAAAAKEGRPDRRDQKSRGKKYDLGEDVFVGDETAPT